MSIVHLRLVESTLRAVVSPGRKIRVRNHCGQPFDFPSSLRVHVMPTSNVKWRHFLLICGKILPVRAVPGSGSPKTPHTFWSLLQPSSFVPIPLWIQRARFKDSNYKRKQMRESLNLFWNRFYLFKVNIFVHSAGRQLDQRIKRLLAVVSLTYRLAWRNHCSQGRLSHKKVFLLGIVRIPSIP